MKIEMITGADNNPVAEFFSSSNTPETNEAQHEGLLRGNPMPTQVVHVNFARKLERERDEARERIEKQKLEIVRLNGATNHAGGTPLKIALRERDEWAAMCGRYKQERDRVREALADWENAAAHVEADHPDEKHCGCVPVLRKLLNDARSERDEAREAFVIATDQVVLAQSKLRETDKERQAFVTAQQEVITNLILERNQALDKINYLNNTLQTKG